jgi:ABC-type multidrug transport system fused ATPase/permease subunit
VSVVPQDAVMFNDTLRFNITLGAEPALGLGPREDWLTTVLRRCALQPLIERLPQGLDTQIGERGFKLSGGERQRIAIARAIYRRPRILLLDEATSSLDQATEQAVLMTIRSIGKDYTTMPISHEERLRAIADRTLVLHEGVVVEHDGALPSGAAAPLGRDPCAAAKSSPHRPGAG